MDLCSLGETVFPHCVVVTLSEPSWAGDYGKLGLGDNECQLAPVRVTRGMLQRRAVTQVAAGSHHTVCVCSDGSMFAWGDGIYLLYVACLIRLWFCHRRLWAAGCW